MHIFILPTVDMKEMVENVLVVISLSLLVYLNNIWVV